MKVPLLSSSITTVEFGRRRREEESEPVQLKLTPRPFGSTTTQVRVTLLPVLIETLAGGSSIKGSPTIPVGLCARIHTARYI